MVQLAKQLGLQPAPGSGTTPGLTNPTLTERVALLPTAYPLSGSEPLWPHHEAIVRDILVDCDGTVIWGGDLSPTKASHFQLGAGPGDSILRRVAARLDASARARSKSQTAGMVADPAMPTRRRAAKPSRPR